MVRRLKTSLATLCRRKTGMPRAIDECRDISLCAYPSIRQRHDDSPGALKNERYLLSKRR